MGPQILAILASITIMVACVTVPGSNRRAINFMPDGQMNSLGLQAYQDVLKTEKKSKNFRMTAVVREIGNKIARASGEKFKWEFNLIDSNKINAFCLPGGKVAVYTGILKVAQNTAGLAAIMGHEVAHAVARHGGERMSHGVLAQAGLAGASLSLSNNKYRGAILGALGVGAQVGVMLPFSRSHETEADVLGMQYMAKAGYNPIEASHFWTRMNKGGSAGPEFMSTHPNPVNRANALRKMASSSKIRNLYARSRKQITKRL